MGLNKVADVLERFARTVEDMADELRHNAPDGPEEPDEPAYDDGPAPRIGREVEDDGTREDTLLAVPAGDLWRLVNRSRKMIRLAREGKIPDMNGRAPLRDAIRALKAQGLVRKPHNLRD